MRSMELVDIGINLGNEAYRHDLDQVIDRAVAAGVTRMVVTGTSVTGSRNATQIAAGRPGALFATAGVHPHDARHWDAEARAAIAALVADPVVVAVGECGLDFNRDFSPRADQERCFEEQVALAAETVMPAFLHERDAHQRLIDILRPWRDRLPRAVLHCFTGTGDELRDYLDLDLHIGITGWICDERRGHHLRELVSLIPEDRLMVETDGPYLLPRDVRPRPPGRRNEPAFLPHILRSVAACRGVSPAALAATTTATASAFFNLGS